MQRSFDVLGHLQSDDPLFEAVEYGRCEKLLELIKLNFDLTILVSPRNWTLLHLAATKGQTNIVKILLQHGANINAIEYFGNTPLHMAIHEGRTETAKVLVEHGASLDIKNLKGQIPYQCINERIGSHVRPYNSLFYTSSSLVAENQPNIITKLFRGEK